MKRKVNNKMEITTTARHIEMTDAIKNAVKKSVQSIEHLFSKQRKIKINAILDTEGHHGEYSCHLTLNTDRIHSLNISQKNHNLYKAISIAANRLKENIHKHLSKLKTKN